MVRITPNWRERYANRIQQLLNLMMNAGEPTDWNTLTNTVEVLAVANDFSIRSTLNTMIDEWTTRKERNVRRRNKTKGDV